jgi:hypothetical protein
MRGVRPASLAQKTMKNPNHNSTQGTPRIGFSAVLGGGPESRPKMTYLRCQLLVISLQLSKLRFEFKELLFPLRVARLHILIIFYQTLYQFRFGIHNLVLGYWLKNDSPPNEKS